MYRFYSIFKNKTQIGWWNKEAVTWFEGDNYSIIANDDVDCDLIISFCLIMDNYASKNHDETVTIDLGNIGFMTKKFDPNWQPNYK